MHSVPRLISPCSSFRRNGVTLLEMLIAGAVLAILGMLLVTTFRGAVDWSRAAGCASNLRQFHSALQWYAQENENRLPAYRMFNVPKSDGTTGNGPDWRQRLEPYLPEEPKPRRNSLRRPTMDVCTAATFESSSSYTFYYAFTADSTSGNPRNIYQVVNPTRYFVMGDSQGSMRIRPTHWWQDMQFRHNGKANFLFLDGHVESLDELQVPRSPSQAFSAFWEGN